MARESLGTVWQSARHWPSAWQRFKTSVRSRLAGVDVALPPAGPRYRYVSGMERPDARFTAIPGPLAAEHERRRRLAYR
jgi:hypothetical protein